MYDDPSDENSNEPEETQDSLSFFESELSEALESATNPEDSE